MKSTGFLQPVGVDFSPGHSEVPAIEGHQHGTFGEPTLITPVGNWQSLSTDPARFYICADWIMLEGQLFTNANPTQDTFFTMEPKYRPPAERIHFCRMVPAGGGAVQSSYLYIMTNGNLDVLNATAFGVAVNNYYLSGAAWRIN